MGSIKDIFVTIFANAKNQLLVAGASVILLLFLLNRWNQHRYEQAKEQIRITQINLAAAQDTIRVTRAKNKKLEYNRLSYVASNKNLTELNASLVKEIENTKGKVATIQNIGFKVVHDTISMPTTVYVEDSVVKIRSKIDTTYSNGNFRALAFESTYKAKEGRAYSILTEDKIGFTATVGVKLNEKKQYEIFVRPHYPDMQVGLLEGAIIEDNLFKKETKIKVPLVTVGGNIGWVPFTYDLNTQKSSINLNRIGVSVGLNFNLSAILKK